MGATIVPVSVDPIDKSRELKEKLKLSFDLYRDADGKLASSWGVFDKDSGYNLAATFVVAKGGEVIYRHIGEGYKVRPTAEALMAIAGNQPE